jgi:hypothetical protein
MADSSGMDPRASTAPGAKERRWSKSASVTRLLRQPSAKIASAPRAEIVAAADRPRPKLAPQFHWNLNSAALKTLSKTQVEQLYGLFTFYDSSATGDDLPSITSARLVQILRDARLMNGSDGSEATSTTALEVESVERIFAQAVMGKMRVYLDADGQPALTFPLFCGALMSCAMLLSPQERPHTALRQILPRLLQNAVVEGRRISSSKGLLSHINGDGAISLWKPDEAHACRLQTPGAQEDFRKLPAFQQVIADCTRDKGPNQDKASQHSEIPDRLLASFHPDTIALVSFKFRLFDVNDRGVLPRNEVFALLSCLGRQLDLPDPYMVLAKLSSFNAPPRGLEAGHHVNSDSSGGLTLVELLQVIDTAREAKRHSATAKLAAMKIRMNRATSSMKGTTSRATPSSGVTSESGGASNHAVEPPKGQGQHRRSSIKGGVVEHGRRHGVVGLKARKGQDAVITSASSSLLGNGHHADGKRNGAHHSSTSSRKKTLVNHKALASGSDSHSTSPSGGHDQLLEQNSARNSGRSSTTAGSSSRRQSAKRVLGSCSLSIDDLKVERDDAVPVTSRSLEEHDVPDAITIEVHEPASLSNSKMVRIFLLLGGDHDGAICCTLSLTFATKEITETEGVYFTAAPSETTRIVPVVPRQQSLTNALRMLKKCVLAKLNRSFELRPKDQLDVVENMLQQLWIRQPHFSSPITKACCDSPHTARAPGRPRPTTSSSQRALVAPRPLSSAAPVRSWSSLPHRTLAPPLAKPAHQFKLPSNYKDLLATWEVSQSNDHSWIHHVNSASPLQLAMPSQTQSNPCLSPLRLPRRPNNQASGI